MSKIKMASFDGLAKENIKRGKSYHRPLGESSGILKELLGVLLLRLATGQAEPNGWQLFDQLLRQLYDGGDL